MNNKNDKTIKFSVKNLKKLYELLIKIEKDHLDDEYGRIEYYDLLDCLHIVEHYSFKEVKGKPKAIWEKE